MKQKLSLSLPLGPATLESVYEDFKQQVLPYPPGNIHPRFWGWVMGTGTPLAMLAEMLAAGMNSWVGGFNQSATLVEEQVLSWRKEMLGFPEESSGVLTSGCTVANIIGLTVARHAKAPFDVRKQGLQHHTNAPMVVYCSSEVHSWAQKAVELLGLGDNSLHRVPLDSTFRIDIQAYEPRFDQTERMGNSPSVSSGVPGQ